MKYSKLFLFALFITIINLTIQEKCAECSETATYRTRVKRTWYPYPYGFYDPFGYRFGPFGQYGSFGVVGTRFGPFRFGSRFGPLGPYGFNPRPFGPFGGRGFGIFGGTRRGNRFGIFGGGGGFGAFGGNRDLGFGAFFGGK